MDFLKRYGHFCCFVGMVMLLMACSARKLSKVDQTGVQITQADPTIFFHDGQYYLYGTDGDDAHQGIKVFRSADLENWEEAVGVLDGYALHSRVAYGDRGFWAPQVWEHAGRFYMAYTANENIAIASGSSPLGPFAQVEQQPLIADGKQIDPFIFHDDDGKTYLFHVRLQAGNRIFVAELEDGYRGIVAGTLKECIHAELKWENTDEVDWPVVEGPTVIKYEGRYYLFYSANDFRNKQYAVGVAVADKVYGPWERIGESPLLSMANTHWAGTGHGDVFRNDKGWYYICHTHYSDEKVGPRKTAIVPFAFVHDKNHQIAIPRFDASAFRHLYARKKE
ncbi:glycoside hydrolase family 43 protein [Olivibacter sitiensis]|uniref:glycoside hydrolase family 43 protein n=1 Tax=Olivibacter sitiensis TaxID=376470 RepID=UPI00041AAC23|nr:glycoside hydrolase family 43 protein [Olivibacter sitiensis]